MVLQCVLLDEASIRPVLVNAIQIIPPLCLSHECRPCITRRSLRDQNMPPVPLTQCVYCNQHAGNRGRQYVFVAINVFRQVLRSRR